MNSTLSCLEAPQINAFLNRELTPQEIAEMEEHLTDCQACRSTIKLTIGDQDWWNDVEGSLRNEHSFNEHQSEHPTADRLASSQLIELLGPTDDPNMLGRIGGYEIVGILGRGGMGAVFKGFDRALNRYVAIKILLPHLAASGAARQRFAREAQAAAAVVDDHVMAIHCVESWQGIPYFVMTYSRGESLQKRLGDDGPLEVKEILRIALQSAKGLAAAHAQGLVHRDVKPANIFLDEGVERVQIMDFGLARAVDDASLTRSGVIAGTPQYMSPEQARAESVDAQSDLFSLGSVIYAMCTGHPPFRAETSYGVLRLITDHEPRPIRDINADIPDWLCVIVDKLMAKQKQDRYRSADEVATLLETCLAHLQQPTVTSLPRELVQNPKSSVSRNWPKRRVIFAAIMTATILIAGGLWAAKKAPGIAGQWEADDWGVVTIEPVAGKTNQYHGEFTSNLAAIPSPHDKMHLETTKSCWACHNGFQAGTFDLKWSRFEHRYNGTWRQGEDVFGKISLRTVDDEIRGAWTTSKQSNAPPSTPALAELVWTRREKLMGREQAELEKLKAEFDDVLLAAREIEKATKQAEQARREMEKAADVAEQARELVPDVRDGLDKFPMKSVKSAKTKHTVSPPKHQEVLAELEKKLIVEPGVLTGIYEKHRDNFRIVVARIYDIVDPPRLIPLVGSAQLHRVRFEATVTFDQTGKIKWPVPATHKKTITEKITIDRDHLDVIDKSQDSIASELPKNTKVHVVGCYTTQMKGAPVTVRVENTGRPMVVVLTSYFGVHWKLDVEDGADIRGVIASSYYEPELQSLNTETPLIIRSYYPIPNRLPSELRHLKMDNLFYLWSLDKEEQDDENQEKMVRILNELTGFAPSTFQGQYFGTSFTIDGKSAPIKPSR